MESHRNLAPGIYNENRLRETPLPTETDDNGSDNDDLTYDFSSSDSENEQSFEEIIIPNNNASLNNSENPLSLSTGSVDESGTVVSNEVGITEEANSASTLSSTEHAASTVSITVANGVVGITQSNDDSNEDIPTVEHAASEQNTSSTDQTDTQTDTQTDNQTDNQTDTQTEAIGANTSSNEDVAAIHSNVQNVIQQNVDIVHTVADQNESAVQNVDKSSQSATSDVKPNIVPLYEMHRANQNAILDQLEDRIVETVDDMEITITSKGFGKPFNTTAEGFIKLEEPDEISGFIPYMNTVKEKYLYNEEI